jgi:hypothetical protein
MLRKKQGPSIEASLPFRIHQPPFSEYVIMRGDSCWTTIYASDGTKYSNGHEVAGRCPSASERAGISAFFRDYIRKQECNLPSSKQEKHKKILHQTWPKKATEREEVASVVWETGVKNIAISCVFVVPVTILKRGSWLVHQFEELSLIFFVHIFSM